MQLCTLRRSVAKGGGEVPGEPVVDAGGRERGWTAHVHQGSGRTGERGGCSQRAALAIVSRRFVALWNCFQTGPCVPTRVAQNARGVVKGVVKGVTKASFGRRAPLTPQLKRASTRRREEEIFRGVHMIQQVAAVHLGWGQAPSLDTKMRHESAIWVLLERYGEYLGCYLGRRAGVLAA